MTIGFRKFIEMCDDMKVTQAIEKLDGTLTFEPFAVLTDIVGPLDNYDFGEIYTKLSIEDRGRLSQHACALGDDLRLPDRFAIVFSYREAKAVAVFGCGSVIAGADSDESEHFRAAIFMHDSPRDQFAFFGETVLGGWIATDERRPPSEEDWERVGSEFADEVLSDISEYLNVFLMLLHLRTEDEITVLKTSRPSESQLRFNSRRARLGQLPLPAAKIVWVGVEPLKRWIVAGPPSNGNSSKSPHDRRAYYRRPKGGHEKTQWVKAARIHGGANEPGVRETIVRLRQPSTKTVQ